MSKGRDWNRDRQRWLRRRAQQQEAAEREQKAYLRDLEAAARRAAVWLPRSTKAELRQEAAAATAAYLAKGGKIAGWSAWREVTANERTPLLGDQFTPTRKGFMWERSKGRDLAKTP